MTDFNNNNKYAPQTPKTFQVAELKEQQTTKESSEKYFVANCPLSDEEKAIKAVIATGTGTVLTVANKTAPPLGAAMTAAMAVVGGTEKVIGWITGNEQVEAGGDAILAGVSVAAGIEKGSKI